MRPMREDKTMEREANATIKGPITGMLCGLSYFEPGARVHVSQRTAEDRRNGWCCVQGLKGYPTIVCVPMKHVELDAR